jgi:alanine-glyoxylate transaminase/serine-glyoxylate transaminase/serine-pyruvate transaminase
MPSTPLLMIPGPVEVSPAVLAAAAAPPRGHLDPRFVDDFAALLAALRRVWRAGPEAAPFVVPGGGTIAMESAAVNLVDPGERALVVSTGYFGERMAEMLRRRGAEVARLEAPAGDAPSLAAIEDDLARARQARRPTKALFATHVDTSTGVRVDPEPIARLARRYDVLAVFDGVCATAGERFEMAAWDADLYFTASQKALGLPPGLALWAASPRALAARRALATPPPLALDWEAWRPVLEGYESGRPAYFSTPATSLVAAARAGLEELLVEAVEPAAAMAAAWARHERAARALRAAWSVLGLAPVPVRPELLAHTLSALRFPAGRGNELIAAVRDEGVQVAGGLHRELAGRSFRVGHMGHVTRDSEPLARTVRAVGAAVAGRGSAVAAAAVAAFEAAWSRPARGAELAAGSRA